ncbi:MAG: hypothetical protein L6N95_01440 [Candidatus Methylarchaceae archaeon HK01B]|nr:hypothetical protein [Candidatus Methylarchaceae archaeon HK01M]MCP8312039.1 hypothetical protein [Candidatus Methylarchaceae archaeon HK02M1]MCP8318476.1 hypothetical protein [Candidatus Methylarchaceae archaeon HK01B]
MALNKINPIDQLFWTRVSLGIATGFLSGLMGFLGNEAYKGLLLALIAYIISYFTAKYIIKLNLPPKESHKILTTGIGSFIALWLFTWIIYTTFFTHPI